MVASSEALVSALVALEAVVEAVRVLVLVLQVGIIRSRTSGVGAR